MEWDIKRLDCDKMKIHPLSPRLHTFLEESIPTLKSIKTKYIPVVFTKTMVYRYIVLMYDPNSDIQKLHQLDWFGKKYEAAGHAGFPLRNIAGNMKFHKEVDDMVYGRIDWINDIIIEFLAWLNNMQWQYIIFLQESMLGFVRDSLGRKITKHKSSDDYMKLYRDFTTKTQEFIHLFDEPQDFVDRFYYKLTEARMAVNPESYANILESGSKLESDNPYGSKYVIDSIKFIGDDEEQVEES